VLYLYYCERLEESDQESSNSLDSFESDEELNFNTQKRVNAINSFEMIHFRKVRSSDVVSNVTQIMLK
jgi:hypothetical protein